MSHEGLRTPRSVRESPRTAALGALLLVLVALAAAMLPGVGVSTPARPLALGLALSAQPLQGTVPLVVAFRAALTPNATTATFDWSFGDGSSYSEVATGYSAVDHAYDAPGAFSAHVVVASASGDANATVLVQVSTDSLTDAISATPLAGTAPLTVQFQALPSGGTGTYTSFLWQFGDGDNGSGADLAYTFVRPGDFNVSLNVTDSAGTSARAYAVIHVAAGPGAAPRAGDGPTGPTWAVLVALGLVALAIVLGATRWTLRRPLATPAPPPPAPPSRTPVAQGSAPSGPPTPEAMEEAAAVPLRGVEESRRLSERLLVHLYWYGRSAVEGVASFDASQAGMAQRFNVTQNAVSKALQRLVEAGTVSVELRHVPGAPRRLKTYSLTRRGEAIARTLRVDREPRPKG